MFDFSKLGDMTKLASQATQLQEKQEVAQERQIELLEKISNKLDTLIELTKRK